MAFDADNPPAHNITKVVNLRDDTDNGFFTSAGRKFLGFPTNDNDMVLNAAKTAFLDIIMLILHALQHSTTASPTFLRYFKASDSCAVSGMLNHFFGPSGNGLDAFRDPVKPLRIVWLDNTLVGGRADRNSCTLDPTVVATFITQPADGLGPAMLLCQPFLFSPDVANNKHSLSEWSGLTAAGFRTA